MLYCKHIIWPTSIRDPRYRVSHSFLKQSKSFTDSSITCHVLGWYNLSKKITHFDISNQNCKVLVRNSMNFMSDTAFTVSTTFHSRQSTFHIPNILYTIYPFPYFLCSMVSLSLFITTFFFFFFCVNPSFTEMTSQLKWKYFLSI